MQQFGFAVWQLENINLNKHIWRRLFQIQQRRSGQRRSGARPMTDGSLFRLKDIKKSRVRELRRIKGTISEVDRDESPSSEPQEKRLQVDSEVANIDRRYQPWRLEAVAASRYEGD
ncbi:unnamed protein product [Polarella glacialis]|uniref:Uncharacterized protein n=1 Tax=Polarella glacialis TaxID=89957 RepID=A0A813D6Q6_POLGL|nr:unnamed protein product [Polarella glacialis]